MLLGCGLRRCEVAALTGWRCSGAFTPEPTVAARHANAPGVVGAVLATPSACRPHRLAVAATDNALLAPELAAGIARVASIMALRRCQATASCKHMELKQEIDEALETLEALYFFTQGLKGEAGIHLEKVRAIYGLLLKQGYPTFLADIRRDVALVKEHYTWPGDYGFNANTVPNFPLPPPMVVVP